MPAITGVELKEVLESFSEEELKNMSIECWNEGMNIRVVEVLREQDEEIYLSLGWHSEAYLTPGAIVLIDKE